MIAEEQLESIRAVIEENDCTLTNGRLEPKYEYEFAKPTWVVQSTFHDEVMIAQVYVMPAVGQGWWYTDRAEKFAQEMSRAIDIANKINEELKRLGLR